MAGSYQVTQAIEAEQQAVKRATTEIEALKARKNASTTAIRSWRFKYRAWKMRVEIADKKKSLSEDELTMLKRSINAYNRSIRTLSHTDTLIANEGVIRRYEQKLETLNHRIDNLRNTKVADKVASELSDSAEKALVASSLTESFKRKMAQQQEQEARYEDYQQLKNKHDEQEAQYEDYQQAQHRYEEQEARYEEYVAKMRVWEREYAEYQERQKSYSKANDWITDLIADEERINKNDYQVDLVEVSGDYTPQIIQEGVSELSAELMQTYTNYPQSGLEAVLDINLWQVIGQPNWSGVENAIEDGDEMGAQRALSQAIYQQLDVWRSNNENAEYREILMNADNQGEPVEPEPVPRPIRPERVEKPAELEPVEQPKLLEPVAVPSFTAEINYTPEANTNSVDEKLLAELDEYGQGSYDNTRNHFEEINALAENVGHKCPKIAIVETKFDNSALLSALSEVEASWSGFGSQRNSDTGVAIISRFKDSVNQLKDATDYNTLTSSATKFSESSTQLFVWLSSNWWQNGGRPGGEAHPWKPAGARVLKK